MEALRSYELISVDEYLASELRSEHKHEYLGGVVHAMSGARIKHDRVVTNISGLVWNLLRGKRCRPHSSDMKIRIRYSDHVRFYYPDVSVVCQSNPPEDSFQDNPVVIVEVLSESTRRTDLGEKKDAYLTIPTLSVLLLVEQDERVIQAFRRTDTGFVREVHLDGVVPLPEIESELSLAEVYAGVE